MVLALGGIFVWTAVREETVGGSGVTQSRSIFSAAKTTLYLWYSDDALTDYLNEVAVACNDSNRSYRVEPKLVDDAEFLEKVNSASVAGDSDMPDIYIIPDSGLGRAYEAGLASEITDTADFADKVVYPAAAQNAVTYKGKIVAYPFYFQTSALLYNSDYLDSIAETAGCDSESLIPSTIRDILSFADNYDAPENVTSVFDWDVNDIFYNYYFIGDTMDVGGKCGDDESEIDIYNAPTIQALQVYQKLAQFFSIDTSTSSYDTVMDNFVSGKTVFTVATTDAVQKIADAASDGTFTWNYGVSALPDITEDFDTKGLAVTNCLVVNDYSEHPAEANAFIQFLLNSQNTDFCERTGYTLARNGCTYSDDHMSGFFDAYQESVPEPKMISTENFWMYAENAMQQVWDGVDPNATLKSLYEQVEVQITGDDSFMADSIEDPEALDVIPDTEEGSSEANTEG